VRAGERKGDHEEEEKERPGCTLRETGGETRN